MRSREDLIEEFEEWTKRYIEADEHLKSLLPHISDLSRGERLQPLVITDKWLADVNTRFIEFIKWFDPWIP